MTLGVKAEGRISVPHSLRKSRSTVSAKYDVNVGSRSAWNFSNPMAASVRVPLTNYYQPNGYCARLIVEIWTYQYSVESDWDLPQEHIYSSPILYLFAVTPLIVAAHDSVMRVGCC